MFEPSDNMAITSVRVVSMASPVGMLVTRPATCVDGRVAIADAAEAMRLAGVSALVVDDGSIVTERDIARAVAAHCDPGEPVASVASPNPPTVPAAMPVVAAAGLMLNEGLEHLLVVDDGATIGVVSIRDLLAVLLQDADPHLWLNSLRVVVEAPEIWLG